MLYVYVMCVSEVWHDFESNWKKCSPVSGSVTKLGQELGSFPGSVRGSGAVIHHQWSWTMDVEQLVICTRAVGVLWHGAIVPFRSFFRNPSKKIKPVTYTNIFPKIFSPGNRQISNFLHQKSVSPLFLPKSDGETCPGCSLGAKSSTVRFTTAPSGRQRRTTPHSVARASRPTGHLGGPNTDG